MYQTPSVENDIEWFSTRHEAEQFCKALSIQDGLCNIREVDEDGHWVWGVGYKNGDRTKFFSGGMRTMKIAVLDYMTGTVEIFEAPEMTDGNEIEEYLSNEKGFHLSNCSWMCGVKQVCNECITLKDKAK